MVKQARAFRTHDQILDAAAAEFALHGYAGTNLAVVATRTGMSKGALYGHFASKQALADALVNESAETWRVLYRTAAKVQKEPSLRDLVLAVSQQMKINTRFRATVRLAGDCTLPAGGAPDLLACMRGRITAAAARAHQNARPASPLATQSPQIVAHLLLTVAYGLSFGAERGATTQQPETMDEVWKLLLTCLQLEDTAPT